MTSKEIEQEDIKIITEILTKHKDYIFEFEDTNVTIKNVLWLIEKEKEEAYWKRIYKETN